MLYIFILLDESIPFIKCKKVSLKVSIGTGDFSVDVHVHEYNQYQCKISASDYSQIFLIGIYSGREFGWF